MPMNILKVMVLYLYHQIMVLQRSVLMHIMVILQAFAIWKELQDLLVQDQGSEIAGHIVTHPVHVCWLLVN